METKSIKKMHWNIVYKKNLQKDLHVLLRNQNFTEVKREEWEQNLNKIFNFWLTSTIRQQV